MRRGGRGKKKHTMFCCPTCRCTDVECLDWVKANSNEVVGDNEVFGIGDRWCPQCEAHPTHFAETVIPKPFVPEDTA